jgi:hypothetical protein
MTDMNETSNVTPLRPKDPAAALRARRARRKHKTVTATVTPTVTLPVTGVSPVPSENPNEINSTVTVLGNLPRQAGMSGLDIGRSVAIRDAARHAAEVAAPESSYLTKLVTLEPVGRGPRRLAGEGREEAVGRSRPVLHHAWSAFGRVLVGLAIVGTGAWIAITSMRGNAWFGHSLTPDPVAGDIYATLSVAAEVLACLIPTGIRFYAASGERWTVFYGWALMAVALTVVFFAAGGFAITNIHSGIEARIERETPAMRDLRTQLAGLDRSIASECAKRSDRCRELERQRADANAKLGIEWAGTKADADPQAVALGISSLTLHLVQAGAMVALCLFSGLFISFGAGLIWSRKEA